MGLWPRKPCQDHCSKLNRSMLAIPCIQQRDILLEVEMLAVSRLALSPTSSHRCSVEQGHVLLMCLAAYEENTQRLVPLTPTSIAAYGTVTTLRELAEELGLPLWPHHSSVMQGSDMLLEGGVVH